MQSHLLASLLWGWLNNMMKHIFNLKLTVSGPSSELRICSIKHWTSFCITVHEFSPKGYIPRDNISRHISVDGTMICKTFKSTRVWMLFVLGTSFGKGFQPSQGNERNLSFLGGTLFSSDASRTMSAWCGSEKWPKFVHFWHSSRTPWAAHIVAHLLAAHDQWAWVCSYVPPDFKEGQSRLLHRLHDSDPGDDACSNCGKVQKWETNGLINAVLAINAVLGAVN